MNPRWELLVATILTPEQSDWFEAEVKRLRLSHEELLRELVDRARRTKTGARS